MTQAIYDQFQIALIVLFISQVSEWIRVTVQRIKIHSTKSNCIKNHILKSLLYSDWNKISYNRHTIHVYTW
jgi:hypothetical protein